MSAFPASLYESPVRSNLLETELVGQDRFFGLAGKPNYDWPNPIPPRQPPGPVWDTHVRFIGQDTFFGLAGKPNFDWSNPVLRVMARQDFVQDMPVQLIGQDRIYRGPGQVPSYDYPNPTLRIQPRQDWTQDTPLQLIGQDRIYGGPGQVPGYDWPNPRGATVSLNILSQYNLSLYGVAFVQPPLNQYDWPNPAYRQFNPLDFATQNIALLGPVTPTPVPDQPTNGGVPGRVQLMSAPHGRTQEEEKRHPELPHVESTNDATAEYQRRSAKLSRALVRLRDEQIALRAKIAQLEAEQTAKAERELLLQRQALQYAALQEAIVLEEITVIDVAFVAVVALTLH